MTKRMANGIHEIRDDRALVSIVSRGKHSRGNWVLANKALFDSRAVPPLPRHEEK